MKGKIKDFLGKFVRVVLGVFVFDLLVTGLQLLFGESSFADLYFFNLLMVFGSILVLFVMYFLFFVMYFVLVLPIILLNWIVFRRGKEVCDDDSRVCSDNYDHDWLYFLY